MSGCYLRGTRILTQNGEIAVEDLQIGDIVVSRFGSLRPIKWIGRQSFGGQAPGKAPVCFRAGSVAEDVPARDLFVAPANSLIFGDWLVRADLLVNGATITQTATDEQVEYYGLDLGAHDCVIANGTWGESYRAQNNRAMFDNHRDFAAAFPDHVGTDEPPCLPEVARSNEELAKIRAKLIARAPAECFTSDIDLHIVADGLRIDGQKTDESHWAFDIPAGVRTLYLGSNMVKPIIFGESRDERPLGFCLEKISSEMPAQTVTLKAGHQGLGEGVHPVETDGKRSWQWTKGLCRLPGILLDGNAALSARITVKGHGLARYPAPPRRATQAAVLPVPN